MENLLAVRVLENFGTVLIFDDRNFIPGMEFCTRFSNKYYIINAIQIVYMQNNTVKITLMEYCALIILLTTY